MHWRRPRPAPHLRQIRLGDNVNTEQYERVRTGSGFIAALDQSGGSTPKALAAYGVTGEQYASSEEMFDLVHAFRARIATAPAFDTRILGAILFEDTMRRTIENSPAVQYLWDAKDIVPFVKIDKGLADPADDVQLLAPMPSLTSLLAEAASLGVFGTKARSVIHEANPAGIDAVVRQQFAVGEQVLAAGLVPIIEPEVSIESGSKRHAEDLLLEALSSALNDASAPVMLKLTLPETANHYRALVDHPKVVRVVALSGGYSLTESVQRLGANIGVIASFSRALTDGLLISQSDAEFNAHLDRSIQLIFEASSS